MVLKKKPENKYIIMSIILTPICKECHTRTHSEKVTTAMLANILKNSMII